MLLRCGPTGLKDKLTFDWCIINIEAIKQRREASRPDRMVANIFLTI